MHALPLVIRHTTLTTTSPATSTPAHASPVRRHIDCHIDCHIDQPPAPSTPRHQLPRLRGCPNDDDDDGEGGHDGNVGGVGPEGGRTRGQDATSTATTLTAATSTDTTSRQPRQWTPHRQQLPRRTPRRCPAMSTDATLTWGGHRRPPTSTDARLPPSPAAMRQCDLHALTRMQPPLLKYRARVN